MKEETSGIPVSQEKLLNIADDWEQKAKAHPELDEYGINQEFITQFETDKAAAREFKTADEVDKETAVFTANKRRKNKECYKWIKTAHLHYEKVYPDKNSPEYKLFPSDYARANRDDVHTANIIPDITKLLTDNQGALVKKGMKIEFIAQGTTLLSELQEVQMQHKKKLEDDELYTIKRRIALSKVYNAINQISQAGKLKYENDPTIGDYFDTPWPKDNKKASTNNTVNTQTVTEQPR